MERYHINNNDEIRKCVATQKTCQYGSISHYTSREAAEKALGEERKSQVHNILKKLKAPENFEEFEDQIKMFFPKKSKLFQGVVFNSLKPAAKSAQERKALVILVSSQIRKDIARAKKVGEIPGWLSVSIKGQYWADNAQVTIKIGIKKDGRVETIPPDWVKAPPKVIEGYTIGSRQNNTSGKAIVDYIERIAEQYSTSEPGKSAEEGLTYRSIRFAGLY